MVLLEIKQAARSHCKEAIERLAGHMRSKDERVSMLACIAILERGARAAERQRGRAQFAIVPAVMDEAEWLERRGRPKPLALPPPDDDAPAGIEPPQAPRAKRRRGSLPPGPLT
jgi:hypothetical protein